MKVANCWSSTSGLNKHYFGSFFKPEKNKRSESLKSLTLILLLAGLVWLKFFFSPIFCSGWKSLSWCRVFKPDRAIRNFRANFMQPWIRWSMDWKIPKLRNIQSASNYDLFHSKGCNGFLSCEIFRRLVILIFFHSLRLYYYLPKFKLHMQISGIIIGRRMHKVSSVNSPDIHRPYWGKRSPCLSASSILRPD